MKINKTEAQGDFVKVDESASKQKEVKKTNNKDKKPGFFSKLGGKIKDIFSISRNHIKVIRPPWTMPSKSQRYHLPG